MIVAFSNTISGLTISFDQEVLDIMGWSIGTSIKWSKMIHEDRVEFTFFEGQFVALCAPPYNGSDRYTARMTIPRPHTESARHGKIYQLWAAKHQFHYLNNELPLFGQFETEVQVDHDKISFSIPRSDNLLPIPTNTETLRKAMAHYNLDNRGRAIVPKKVEKMEMPIVAQVSASLPPANSERCISKTQLIHKVNELIGTGEVIFHNGRLWI